MPLRDLCLILLVCLAWAFNFVAVARGMQQFSPFVFTVLRFAILLALLLPFLKLPPRDQWWRLVVVCLSIGALHFSALFWALGVSEDVSSIAITQQTYVPMTVILAMLILGERVGWRSLAAIAVSFSGVLLLSFDPLMLTQWNVLGIALLSALFQAVGSVYMRGIRGIGVFNFQAWTAAISLPVLLLATLLTPVLAVVFGVLVWGDRPGWRLLAGGALVLAGILAITLRALRHVLATDISTAQTPKTAK
jgi:O-acetylserine/cysteine efflux transporter